jgi:hypothetical protein
MWMTVGLMLALFAASAFLRGFIGKEWAPLMQAPWWVIGPIIAAIQKRPKVETLRVEATEEGVRFGEKLVPRAKLKSALLRREQDKTFVLLRGAGSWGASADVEVKDDEEADRLCSALALDAKSTVAEFNVFGNVASKATGRMVVLAIAALIAAVAGATFAIASHHMLMPIVIIMALLFAMLIIVPAMVYSKQTKLRVGADGINVKSGFAKRQFVSHEDIEKVAAQGAQVIVTRKHGPQMVFDVAREVAKKKAAIEETRRQAESIAWRIEKARQAYQALAGEAPQAALALDRGDKTVRDWIEQLRRVGQGANATFRDVGLTREQLLRVVESTSTAAKERLAAVVALREGLTEEEKPRIRVAADRCAEPAMRERMVRVAFAPEEELIAALDEHVEEATHARR